MLGQTSLEYMYTMGFMLLLFTAVLVVYGLAQADLVEISQGAELRTVCRSAASQISTIAVSGDGTTAALSLPSAMSQYNIFVSGSTRTISVAAWEKLASCKISTSNVTNGTATSFTVSDGIKMSNIGGGVAFG
jgi:hypothetical protein